MLIDNSIQVTFPAFGADVIVHIEPWEDTKSTKVYLITPEQKIYLGFDTIKSTQNRASRTRERLHQYLNGTLDDKYKELDLFGYVETYTMVTFVYKDLNPRIKFYVKNDIMEYSVNDDIIKIWLEKLDFLISL